MAIPPASAASSSCSRAQLSLGPGTRQSTKRTELLLYLWGKTSTSGSPLSLFYSKTRWKTVCFHLQEIVVVHYINSRDKCLENEQILWKIKWTLKEELHRPGIYPENTTLLLLTVLRLWTRRDEKEEEMGAEREISRTEHFFPKIPFKLFYFISALEEWNIQTWFYLSITVNSSLAWLPSH